MIAAPSGAWLLGAAIILPVAVAALAQAVGPRAARAATILAVPPALLLQMMLARGLLRAGAPLVVADPSLGLQVRADGLAVAMMLVAALVVGAVALWSDGRHPRLFWRLLPAQWAVLNVVFVSNDLFTSYLGLELLAFAAMPLFCLDRRPEQLAAALRYLVFAAIGSALYLLGAALLLRATGTLLLDGVAARLATGAGVRAAAALMTAGLLAKTALFPLHAWLPAAHAGAPPAVSALHSALVIKGSFVLLLRLWGQALLPLPAGLLPQLLAALGVLAIVFASAVALMQPRLKLLVAWSTVAQVGYLFLALPLLAADDGARAWTGGLLQAISHGLSKAAMFLAAGRMAELAGDDRIDRLGGFGEAAPKEVAAFAIGGLSLMGLPPSGGFTAKWLLLTVSIDVGQWWWALPIVGGGLLTGGYVYRVLRVALGPASGPRAGSDPAGVRRGAVALGLASASLLPGLLPLGALGLLGIGAPGLPVTPP